MVPLRLAAVSAVAVIALLCALGGTAQATACTGDTWVGPNHDGTSNPGSGDWNTPGDWSAGVPGVVGSTGEPVCITASGTYTVTLSEMTLGQALTGVNLSSFGLGAGSGSGTQTLDVEGSAGVSNSNETNNLTELYVSGTSTIDTSGQLILDATANGTGNNGPDGGAATFDTGTGSTNAGTIVSQVEDSQWQNTLFAKLQNTGTIEVNSGTLNVAGQAGNSQAMTIDSTGAIDVAAGATMYVAAGDGSTFTNGGTIANQGTLTAYTNGAMVWGQNGGAVTGNPVQLEGGETFQDSAGTGPYVFTNCAGGFINGTIPAGQTVTVEGGCAGTTATDGARNGPNSTLTNRGTLDLDAPAGTNGGDAILAGGELDNYGTLNATVEGAKLANQLLVPLVNETGGIVNVSGGQLVQTSGTATSNAGTVNLGAGAVWLVQSGSFTNTGTVAPQIASQASLGQFNLTVGGKFVAGGTLAPSLAAGYAPAAGTEFQFVTGSPFTGTFGAVTAPFTADYTHETANPAYVGIVYGGSGTQTNPGQTNPGQTNPGQTNPGQTTPTRPSVSKVTGGKGAFSLTLACAAGGGACGSYTVTATVVEKVKAGKPVSVAAVGAKKKKKKPETKTKTVTIATGSGTLAAGAAQSPKLSLNAAGKALLKRFGKLRAKVTVTAGGATVSTTTVTITAAAAKKPAKKKK